MNLDNVRKKHVFLNKLTYLLTQATIAEKLVLVNPF